MKVQQVIETKLRSEFTPDYLEVVNESHMHSVPRDSETHFKVVVVSGAFEGKRQVARHQQVYGVLAQELQNGVHALALHTYSPAEWSERNRPAPASPQCLGGSKHDAQLRDAIGPEGKR
jgi:BolA protein